MIRRRHVIERKVDFGTGGMTKTENQTGRQVELDLLKALAIISMILCHCVIQLGLHQLGYEQDVRYWIGDYFFGDYMAVAHAFMFAMGVGSSTRGRAAPPISSAGASGSTSSGLFSTFSATGYTRWPTDSSRESSWRRPSMP